MNRTITVAHLLIIDDDASVRRALEKILVRESYEVTAVADGKAALSVLEAADPESGPELVITDVFMPEMDGIEFLLEVRQLRPDLPIVVVSGGGFAPADFVLEDASQLGADAILSKPFERMVVLDTVRRLLAAGG